MKCGHCIFWMSALLLFQTTCICTHVFLYDKLLACNVKSVVIVCGEMQLYVVSSSQYGGRIISAWTSSILHAAGIVVGRIAGCSQWTTEGLVHLFTVPWHSQRQSVVCNRSIRLLHACRLSLIYEWTCHTMYTLWHYGNHVCTVYFSLSFGVSLSVS